ncbi:MAG: hypothetical protein FWD68_19925 [Alphaproteobacteria bacterium]|nr:hypothetical protein [Alphaproteobacteria bacterium]
MPARKTASPPGRRQWLPSNRPVVPNNTVKQQIIEACEALIRDVLKPRYLPRIKPSRSCYPVDICGAWAAGRYRISIRYRSGFPQNRGMEFNELYARLDHMGINRFDIFRMRHTGQWMRRHTGLTLTKAIKTLEADFYLAPPL